MLLCNYKKKFTTIHVGVNYPSQLKLKFFTTKIHDLFDLKM